MDSELIIYPAVHLETDMCTVNTMYWQKQTTQWPLWPTVLGGRTYNVCQLLYLSVLQLICAGGHTGHRISGNWWPKPVTIAFGAKTSKSLFSRLLANNSVKCATNYV